MARLTFLQNKTWRLFFIALLFACMAGLGTIIYLKVLEHRIEARLTPPEEDKSRVVVASHDLQAGARINADNFSVRVIPTTYVPSDTVTPNQFEAISGAILIKPLEQGRMLTMEHVDLNLPKDFAATIQEGHRAITINVDELKSISGLLRPGNHIDIFTRMGAGTAAGANVNTQNGDIIVPVLENVLVIATGKKPDRQNEDDFLHYDEVQRQRTYQNITLELSPENAALLSLARAEGELIAVLRNEKDTSGILFSKMTLQDVFQNSEKLHAESIDKLHNRSVDRVYRNKDGKLVTRDGVEIKDPNVHLNKDGLLVTKNGVVLPGRGLHVNSEGQIVDEHGKPIDTASLMAAKDGTIVDKNGTVLDSNGYHSVKGGFLVDKDGNVYTHDGHLVKGVHVDKNGNVVTADGKVLDASQLKINPDGTVSVISKNPSPVQIGPDGQLLSKNGGPLKASDLVTVGPDGVVRTKDGKILPGVHMGKDGKLYDDNGNPMDAKDILLASKGYKKGQNGTVVGPDGKVYTADDLTTVDPDGTVRTLDGKVLKGVYRDKDGVLRKADGTPLTAKDIIAQNVAQEMSDAEETEPLAGVSAEYSSDFAKNLGATGEIQARILKEIEFIIGGGGDGNAKTFKVPVEERKQNFNTGKKE